MAKNLPPSPELKQLADRINDRLDLGMRVDFFLVERTDSEGQPYLCAGVVYQCGALRSTQMLPDVPHGDHEDDLFASMNAWADNKRFERRYTTDIDEADRNPDT